MSPLWHGLSTVFLDEPRALASPAVVRMLLAGEGRAGLVYAGDRMWPALRHGQAITVRPAAAAEPLEPALRRSIAECVPAGGRVLVAGCGTGRETFAVEAIRFVASGIDFSPRMIGLARAEGARRGSRASFEVADLRTHVEPAGTLAAVLFTYDVYSFLPTRAARTAVLERLRTWLAPGGVLFLSARRARGATVRALLGVQRVVAALRGRRAEWGDSHTRRIDGAGRIRRSFIHVFSPRALEAETAGAGFHGAGWSGGHGTYFVNPPLSHAGPA